MYGSRTKNISKICPKTLFSIVETKIKRIFNNFEVYVKIHSLNPKYHRKLANLTEIALL